MYRILSVEPAYEAEGEFHAPFWEFMYRFQSLQRHWEISKEYMGQHLNALRTTEGDGSAEFWDVFSETAEVDLEFFPEYLRLSTISFSLSLVENLLGNIAEELARETGTPVAFDERKLPYINKHILWLIRGCGIDIHIEKRLWKRLDALRELRNRFIHKIDRDLSEQVRAAITEMLGDVTIVQEPITDELVDASFSTIASFVKRIETAYIYHWKTTSG